MATNVTFSSVSGSSLSKTIVSADADRTGLIITNTSAQILYLRLTETSTSAATATTGHSWRLAGSGGQVDLSSISGRCWKGHVNGIWATATPGGAANVTEAF